jgi:hypothetical protein
VGDNVNSILKDNMRLLRLCLISLLGSLRKDEAYKYRYLLHELNLVEIPESVDDIRINDMLIANPFLITDSKAIVIRNSTTATDSINWYHHTNRKRKAIIVMPAFNPTY